MEAQFQALVELVNHEDADAVGREVLLAQVVQHAPRRAHEDMGTLCTHQPVLVHGRTPAVAGEDAQVGIQLPGHRHRLLCQLARGHEHQGLHRVAGRIQQLQHREQVGQRLS